MKTLLIPTNFTDVARHATDYAIMLYGKENLNIILLNAFDQPKMGRSIPFSLVEIMKKNSEKGLKEDKLRIEEVFPDIDFKIDLKPTQGALSNSIKSILEDQEVDIIVMGSKGDQEIIDIFIESATANVISSVDHPMLIVPPITKTGDFKNIILTMDCKNITNSTIIDELKYISNRYQSVVKVLNISKQESKKCLDSESQISSYLGNINHDFSYRINADIPTGIYKFIQETNSDIITIIKRKGAGSLVQRLFHQSVSKKIVKHVRQTLLLFTDQNY